MELVKDIYFNTDKLIENTDVKVSYTGKFYQGNNEKVFLHYGYDKDWNNLTDVEMTKTDLGYPAELKLIGQNTLNFCFKNQNNEWDNNFGNNYIFNIEKNEAKQEKTENGGNLVFWGKTFGKKDERETSSNVYWKSENNNELNNKNDQDDNTSGVIEDVVNSTPNSIDTILSSKVENTVEKATAQKPLGVTLEKNAENDCFAVIKPAQEAPAQVSAVQKTTCTNTSSIAIAPTGFSYWTKKIKANVCKFFDYLPKIISGNYKRDINTNQNNNK